jgi:hypothetical protein
MFNHNTPTFFDSSDRKVNSNEELLYIFFLNSQSRSFLPLNIDPSPECSSRGASRTPFRLVCLNNMRNRHVLKIRIIFLLYTPLQIQRADAKTSVKSVKHQNKHIHHLTFESNVKKAYFLNVPSFLVCSTCFLPTYSPSFLQINPKPASIGSSSIRTSLFH